MMQKLKQALRSLVVARPGFTALVVLITAFCIGGNASVFSAAKTVLFQKLPYENGDRLVIFSLYYRPTGTDNDLSYRDLEDIRDRTQTLEEVSPFLSWMELLLEAGENVEQIGVDFVTPSHLQLLGIKPYLGRLFSPEEDGLPGSAPVVILSYEIWKRQFGEDREIVGKPIRLNGQSLTVVGVMPPNFFDVAEWRWDVDAWIPVVMAGSGFELSDDVFENRSHRLWYGFGRLKPGVTMEQAYNDLEAITTDLEAEYPETNKDYGASIITLREFMFGDLHPSMRILLVGAALVLFIGCANIAGLLLVRTVERRSELTLRLALGAGWGDLFRQVLLESLILALMGGALGVGLAVVGTDVLSSLVEMPGFAAIELDGTVLAVIAAVSVLTGLIFGLPPAISATRMEAKSSLIESARSGSGGTGSHGHRGRNFLLVFQVAVVTILLIVAGLLLRSFMELRSTGFSFPTKNLLTLRMTFTGEAYEDRQRIVDTELEILRHLKSVPGVEGATVWGPGIPGLSTQYLTIEKEGATEEDVKIRVFGHLSTPGALETLGIPLLQGREFTADDTGDKPWVAIITRSVAEALWPGEDPIGKRMQRAGRANATMTIVGVMPDAKLHGRLSEGIHQLILPMAQRPVPVSTLLVRSRIDLGTMAERLRDEVRKIDPKIPLYDISVLDQLLYAEEGHHRLNAAIVGMYSVLALIFAVLGLYGSLSYSVLQRTQEIGVRVAFGARPKDILQMVMGKGLFLVSIGVAIGLVGSLLVTWLLTSLLYDVTEHDPVTYVAVVAIFTIVALLSTYLPARRALKVEPSMALRFE